MCWGPEFGPRPSPFKRAFIAGEGTGQSLDLPPGTPAWGEVFTLTFHLGWWGGGTGREGMCGRIHVMHTQTCKYQLLTQARSLSRPPSRHDRWKMASKGILHRCPCSSSYLVWAANPLRGYSAELQRLRLLSCLRRKRGQRLSGTARAPGHGAAVTPACLENPS